MDVYEFYLTSEVMDGCGVIVGFSLVLDIAMVVGQYFGGSVLFSQYY